jgi:UDP-N-acetylmuramoylalanine--D-glutamate ligase
VTGVLFNAGVIPRPPPPPGPVLVVGLVRSGVAAALALRARGEQVIGTDVRTLAPDVRARLEAAGVRVLDGEDGLSALAAARSLVKSPGVPQEAPVVLAARRAGLPVIGELELGWRLLPQPFLALTGSNGKTTTVELIGHVHREAGLPAVVAGNVGRALASLAGALDRETLVICEASSFQLEDTEAFAPETAVLLNLAEDHLDRHGTFAAYRAAKLEAFARQPPGSLAVVPAGLALDDLGGAAERVTFGPGGDLAAADGVLLWHGESLMGAEDVRLRGPHNLENAMAAAAACLARGVPAAAVRAGLATFAGVPHRLEEVRRVDGVLYVNDSKATNVAAAAVGLRSFAGGVHAILGGRGKGADYAPLAAAVAERAAAAYLIGEAAAELRVALARAGVPLHDCGDLERAVAAARAAARPGEVVLLSPACASYDQYESFEARGEHFRALVRALV